MTGPENRMCGQRRERQGLGRTVSLISTTSQEGRRHSSCGEAALRGMSFGNTGSGEACLIVPVRMTWKLVFEASMFAHSFL